MSPGSDTTEEKFKWIQTYFFSLSWILFWSLCKKDPITLKYSPLNLSSQEDQVNQEGQADPKQERQKGNEKIGRQREGGRRRKQRETQSVLMASDNM